MLLYRSIARLVDWGEDIVLDLLDVGVDVLGGGQFDAPLHARVPVLGR